MDTTKAEQRVLRDVGARRVARRLRAAERLRSESPELALPLLLKLLADRRSNVQEAAADAWPVLEAAFASDDVDVLGPAMTGIWRFEHARACAMTERLARDADDYPFLREMAVRILGWDGAPESAPAIETALADEQRYVRKAAEDAIAHITARG